MRVVIKAKIRGQLTDEKAKSLLANIERHMADRTYGILFDSEEAQGYDMSVRPIILQWLSDHQDKVVKLAIVSDNQLWHMFLSTLSELVPVEMVVLNDEQSALEWLTR